MMENNGIKIIIIPGNPGIGEYYDEFTDKLKYHMKQKSLTCDIYVNNHIGHENKIYENTFSLSDQIIYHKQLVTEAIKQDNKKIILIGHSIGCYIIMQLMKDPKVNSNVSKILLLFPTIERLGDTPRGKLASYFLKSRFIRWLFFCLMTIFVYLTTSQFRLKLIKWYSGNRVHSSFLKATSVLILPHVLRQVLYMAETELEDVTDFCDLDILKVICQKTFFYYGRKDHWCPLSFYQDMYNRFQLEKLPINNIHLDEDNMDHAFVIKDSEKMAKKLVLNYIDY